MADHPPVAGRPSRRTRGNGEGSIFRDPTSGRWVGKLTLGFDERGRQIRRKFHGSTRAAVAQRMKSARAALDAGLPVPDERLTVGQWLQTWLNGLGDSVTDSTVEAYRFRIRAYIAPHLGLVRLVYLTPNQVKGWLRGLEAEGLAASTRQGARATLRRALRVAEQEGLVSRNVAAIADGPRGASRAGRSLTAEEAKALVRAAQERVDVEPGRPGRRPVAMQRLAGAVDVALGLGLRRGELLGLRWDDVELDAKPPRVTITGQLVRGKGIGLVRHSPKTGRQREIFLPPFVAKALVAQRRRQAAERLAAGSAWTDSGLVFTTPSGTPVDPRNFNRLLAKAAKRADLGHVHPHELRHSAASLALAEGVPIEVVSELLGHSSIRVTKDVYGHLLPGQKAAVAGALERILGS
jgi:integrase